MGQDGVSYNLQTGQELRIVTITGRRKWKADEAPCQGSVTEDRMNGMKISHVILRAGHLVQPPACDLWAFFSRTETQGPGKEEDFGRQGARQRQPATQRLRNGPGPKRLDSCATESVKPEVTPSAACAAAG